MIELLTETAKQAPSLVILALLVRWFLSSMRVRDEAIKDLHQEHIDERTLCRAALTDNTVALRELSQALQTRTN